MAADAAGNDILNVFIPVTGYLAFAPYGTALPTTQAMSAYGYTPPGAWKRAGLITVDGGFGWSDERSDQIEFFQDSYQVSAGNGTATLAVKLAETSGNVRQLLRNATADLYGGMDIDVDTDIRWALYTEEVDKNGTIRRRVAGNGWLSTAATDRSTRGEVNATEATFTIKRDPNMGNRHYREVIVPVDSTPNPYISSVLPITTPALNYADAGQKAPPQLFQFGLAAEDEAREVARRARADGMVRAVALVPSGEWGDRVLAAFRQDWEGNGGTLLAAERIAQPVALAQQIADLFQLRQSEGRAKSLQSTVGGSIAAQPSRRQDIDFIFLASTPQQAQQIKPTLNFQYAGDVPVYATSNLYSASGDVNQYNDMNGIRFCETPWLLDTSNSLRQQVVQQWPQAAGSLGRLYAMGVDAYSLAPRLGQLKALPDNRVLGLSGSLSMNANQRVERQLPWAEFVGGQVQRLPDTAR